MYLDIEYDFLLRPFGKDSQRKFSVLMEIFVKGGLGWGMKYSLSVKTKIKVFQIAYNIF